jgi:hypothetical protein
MAVCPNSANSTGSGSPRFAFVRSRNSEHQLAIEGLLAALRIQVLHLQSR